MREIAGKKRRWRERWPSQHHNPHHNLVLVRVRPTPKAKMRNVELEISSGSRDEVSVYREGPYVYVLSINRPLNYVGLAEYDLRVEPTERRQSLGWGDYAALDPVADVFTQADHEIDSMLGRRGLDLSERTILKRLMQYLPQ
jgi:hypothetical protein